MAVQPDPWADVLETRLVKSLEGTACPGETRERGSPWRSLCRSPGERCGPGQDGVTGDGLEKGRVRRAVEEE